MVIDPLAQRELDLPVRMGIATGEAEVRGASRKGVQPRRGSYPCRLRRGWSYMRRSAVMPVGLIAGVVRAVVGVDQHRMLC